jgi:hypothetical protein
VLLEESGIPRANLHWGVSPSQVSIDTDIVIGASVESPEAVILVTHSTSDDIGLKKFWRNINELLELKAAYPRACIANLFYESGTPAASAQATSLLFDSSLILGSDPKLHPLIEAAASVTKKRLLNADREKSLERIRQWLHTTGQAEKEAAGRMTRWLQSLTKGGVIPPKWAPLLGDCKPAKVKVSDDHTGYRRATSKLTLLSDEDYTKVIKEPQKALEGDYEHLCLLGIGSKGIGGVRVNDRDISELRRTLADDAITYVRNRASKEMDVLPRLREQAYVLGSLGKYASWLRAEWGTITDNKQLRKLLNQCYNDPGSIGPKGSYSPSWHWLLDLLLYVIKHIRGSRHGYSMSKLAVDVGATGIIGRSARLQFSYYIERKKPLPAHVVQAVADHLAQVLRSEGDPASLDSQIHEIAQMRADGVLERMMGAQEFEPLYWLIERECHSQGISFGLDKAVPSFISDLHPKRPGTTKLAFIGGSGPEDCIRAVHCRTAHDGATDKRKELCGRARALRGRQKDGAFHQQLSGKLALVLDGDWTKKDLDLLCKAGWVSIYGPNDITSFVKEIKSEGIARTGK